MWDDIETIENLIHPYALYLLPFVHPSPRHSPSASDTAQRSTTFIGTHATQNVQENDLYVPQLHVHTFPTLGLIRGMESYRLCKHVIRILRRYNDFVESDSIIDSLFSTDDEPTSSSLESNDIICTITDDEIKDPNTVNEARRSKYWNEWLAAINEELAALKAKEVYEPVKHLPDGRRAVQSKWVLHIKQDQNNAITRFKARLVAKGFTQIPRQDFNHTFTPVARWDSIRAILAIATMNDFELRQLDVKTAYLNGPLDEEIFMHAPPNSSTPYWRLCKGLYRLRQAGQQWYLTLHDAYKSLSYTRAESDWSVYSHIQNGQIAISATSVDDILLATNSTATSDNATKELNDKFTLTDSGNAKWLLGCRITRWRERRVLKLDQEQFLVQIL
jgi:hypothetical protein